LARAAIRINEFDEAPTRTHILDVESALRVESDLVFK
jgi:hypothetical protein